MKPQFSQFNPEIYSWEGRNALGGKASYPTRDLHIKWMMNFYIVKEPEFRGRVMLYGFLCKTSDEKLRK